MADRANPHVSGLLEEGLIGDGDRIFLKHNLPAYVTYQANDARFHGTLVATHGFQGAQVRWDHDGQVRSFTATAKQVFREAGGPARESVPGPVFWGTESFGFRDLAKLKLPSTHEAQFHWTRDECMIVLDLYFRIPFSNSSESTPEVLETSRLLRTSSLVARPWPPGFRGPGSVLMRLGNYAHLDPFSGVDGLDAVSEVARTAWNDFQDSRSELRRRVQAISELVELPEPAESIEEYTEGKLVARMHLSRERDPKAVAAAKKAFHALHGRMFCEACGFDFGQNYGPRGEGFIEAHHRIPLSDITHSGKTKPADLAMLCANCHRMVHAKRPWFGVDEVKALVTKTS